MSSKVCTHASLGNFREWKYDAWLDNPIFEFLFPDKVKIGSDTVLNAESEFCDSLQK